MKKFLAILLGCVMVFSLAACGTKDKPAPAPAPQQTVEETPEVKDPVEVVETAGGWEKVTGLELTEEAKETFNKAFENVVDAPFEAVALVGTQVVAGTNYAYLATVSPVAPLAEEDETVEATEVEPTEVAEVAAEAEVAEVAEAVEATEETEVAEAVEATEETEVAEETEVVEATEIEATEIEEEVAEVETKYALVFLYGDLEGNVYFVNSETLDIASAEEFDVESIDLGALYDYDVAATLTDIPTEEEVVEPTEEDAAEPTEGEVVEEVVETTDEATDETVAEEKAE